MVQSGTCRKLPRTSLELGRYGQADVGAPCHRLRYRIRRDKVRANTLHEGTGRQPTLSLPPAARSWDPQAPLGLFTTLQGLLTFTTGRGPASSLCPQCENVHARILAVRLLQRAKFNAVATACCADATIYDGMQPNCPHGTTCRRLRAWSLLAAESTDSATTRTRSCA